MIPTTEASNDHIEVEMSQAIAVVTRAIVGLGYSNEEAATLAEILLFAELRKTSQGLVKLVRDGMKRDRAASTPVARRSPTCAAAVHIDGGRTHAMLVLQGAVDTAVETAQEFGVAIVGVHNLYSSSGALGYYAQRLGRAGMIGAIMTGTPSVVAPFGAKEGLVGTNPLAVAIPRAHGDPVVLDFATAEIALFEVIRRRNLGEELPVGAAKDRFGNPTTDPKAALEGSINCFGGAKGSGLSCILEILTSVFVGAAVADLAEPKRDFGALIICGRPNLFVSGAEYRSALDWFIQQFSLLTPVSDTSNVRLPGANPVNPNRVVVSRSIWAPILKLAGV